VNLLVLEFVTPQSTTKIATFRQAHINKNSTAVRHDVSLCDKVEIVSQNSNPSFVAEIIILQFYNDDTVMRLEYPE
jgi:hypothetical protein